MLFTAIVLFALGSGAPVEAQLAQAQARVQANPADAAAHYDLCRIFYNLEAWDSAVTQCEEAVKNDPKALYQDMLGRAYGSKAENAAWYQAMGFAKKAHAAFEAAVAADGKDARARRDLSDYYIEAPAMLGGSRQKAEQQAAALDAVSRADALYVRARLAETAGDRAKAEQLFKDSLAAAHDPAEPLSELAAFYRRTDKLDAMQAQVERIAALPKPGVALYEGAALLVRTGRNLPGAIKMLERYIDLGGTDEEPIYRALYQLGLAYQKSGDAATAQAKLKKSVEIADFVPAKKALKDLNR